MYRVYWLVEQGLAPKRVFLVIIPLLLFLTTEVVKPIFDVEVKHMEKRKNNTIDALKMSLKASNILCGNMAGGALLANTLYIRVICGDKDGKNVLGRLL